ncbi:hypothetical protein HELRODRAFT_188546 [Helobdella robusta]|uniref:Cilia- and flagella-associated protein 36 n=1 Tax=Helobdella robusta TaxID=6412 RepID=T1FQ39_HELRO|nr:hypothetical protein HELRODRAFT_188546 [Helobdella robusta]ESO01983.1 hypothetical protein HELRODRAFT_188546 [Helobdella robusta]
MASKSRTTIFDEMLTYISEPVFQVPVNSFMDEHCLIFDIDLEPVMEHYKIYESYRKMVDKLLEAFCEDANISQDEVILGISKLNKIPDLHDLFYVYFEQVLSANDFKLFYPLMAKRNILIQEQVLAMILAATGILPDSLTKGPCHFHIEPKRKSGAKADERLTHSGVNTKAVNNEDGDKMEREIMHDVLRKSQTQKIVEEESCEEYFDSKSIEAVEREVKSLAKERKQLEERMKLMFLNSKPDDTEDAIGRKPKLSNELLTASEQEPSIDISKLNILTSSSKLSPEEIANRQNFLRQQRDKLLSMKKEAREKQLRRADEDEKSKNRPVSSRTARLLMKHNGQGDSGDDRSAKKEEEKKLALRRAIAEKLRQEEKKGLNIIELNICANNFIFIFVI